MLVKILLWLLCAGFCSICNWNSNYTKEQLLQHVRKYAKINNLADLQMKLQSITEMTKEVKNEMYQMLVNNFNYFNECIDECILLHF
jgi:hypothetical protein